MARGDTGIYIRVPDELAQLWRFQAWLERKTLKRLFMDAMQMYITNYFKERGYDLEVVEEFVADDSGNINWELLEQAGIDVESFKKALRK